MTHLKILFLEKCFFNLFYLLYSQTMLRMCPELGRRFTVTLVQSTGPRWSCPTFRCSSCASWPRGASPRARSAGTKRVRAGQGPALWCPTGQGCPKVTLDTVQAPHPHTTKYQFLPSAPSNKEQQQDNEIFSKPEAQPSFASP